MNSSWQPDDHLASPSTAPVRAASKISISALRNSSPDLQLNQTTPSQQSSPMSSISPTVANGNTAATDLQNAAEALEALRSQPTTVRHGSINGGAAGGMHSPGPTSVSGYSLASTSSAGTGMSSYVTSSTAATDVTATSFMRRMSNIPLVGAAAGLFEQARASSRVIDYGASAVGSSVRTLSNVIETVAPGTHAQIDQFAGRQINKLKVAAVGDSDVDLDGTEQAQNHNQNHNQSQNQSQSQVGEFAVPSLSTMTSGLNDREGSSVRLRHQSSLSSISSSNFDENSVSFTSARESIYSQQQHMQLNQYQQQQQITTSSTSSTAMITDSQQQQQQQQQQAPATTTLIMRPEGQVVSAGTKRSRWQQVVVGVGAGALAFSAESMRKLRYCLEWLQYARDHISAQINILRDFLSALQCQFSGNPSTHSSDGAVVLQSQQQQERMSVTSQQIRQIRREIVDTVRRVVQVITSYAGNVLPEPAKRQVRSIIMSLPNQWSAVDSSFPASATTTTTAAGTANQSGTGTGGLRRRTSSRSSVSSSSSSASSTSDSPRMYPSSSSVPLHTSIPGGFPVKRPTTNTSSADDYGFGATLVPGSPTLSTSSMSTSSTTPAANPIASEATARRVLAFASESSTMIDNVHGVFSDLVTGAESWIQTWRGLRKRVVPSSLRSSATSPSTTPMIDNDVPTTTTTATTMNQQQQQQQQQPLSMAFFSSQPLPAPALTVNGTSEQVIFSSSSSPVTTSFQRTPPPGAQHQPDLLPLSQSSSRSGGTVGSRNSFLQPYTRNNNSNSSNGSRSLASSRRNSTLMSSDVNAQYEGSAMGGGSGGDSTGIESDSRRGSSMDEDDVENGWIRKRGRRSDMNFDASFSG